MDLRGGPGSTGPPGKKEYAMKKSIIVCTLITVTGFFFFSCASTGYNTQKGAAIGAGLGAIAGQAIGRNTASTLIGTAVGGLFGSIMGNAVDQDMAWQREREYYAQRGNAYGQYDGNQEMPPGEWITVPGQWSDGKWVPSHRVWVPVNP